MKRNNKRITAGLMAMFMVLAVVFSIPAMNSQSIQEPSSQGTYMEEMYQACGDAIERYGLRFRFIRYNNPENPLGSIWVVKRSHHNVSPETAEQVDFETFLKSEEWAKIEAEVYHQAYESGLNYTKVKIAPLDSYYPGLLDGEQTFVLELPDDYVDPSTIPAPSPKPTPSPTPVIEQPPVNNAVTLAPTIQVNNKPMSVKHSTLTVTINGIPTELDAIVLTEAGGGAHTYYKLRDVGEKVGFDVNWTPETGITVNSNK